MKKITLLLLLLSFTFSFGQVVLTEDFEDGLTGWNNNDIAGNGEIWTIETGGVAMAYAPNTYIYDLAQCSGDYAVFNSDAYGDNGLAEEAALESPVFSCAGLTSVTLSFNHFFMDYDINTIGYVEVFNGTTWVTVQTFDDADEDFGFVSIDVSTELAGVTNAQVRFRWTGSYGYGWYVDNVSVFQCTVAAPDAATITEPSNGAIDVPIDLTGANPLITPFSWDPAITGDPADTFNITLGTDIAGTNIGTVTGATSGNGITYGSWAYNTTYYWFVTAVNCAGETPGPVFSFTTAACTALAAPGATTTPGPADGATDVELNDNGGNPSLDFSWVEGAGEASESFTLNLGTSNPPAQAFYDFTNGDPIQGLAVSTTYYWSVDAVNCAGTTTGPVWSFTTASTLSTEENDITLFNVYPNPVKDIVKINTELIIDSINIINHLGQNVLMVNSNRIINNEVDLSSLSDGLYFMNISSGDKSELIKIIKE